MNKKEFSDWFTRQVLPRWPTWQVNDITLADWFAAFSRFDKALLTRAIKHHKIYDDTSSPRTKKLLETIKKLRPPRPERPPAPQDGDRKGYTFEQHWEMIRTTQSKEKRIENMLGWYKCYPKAKEKDPEAYDWVIKDKLHEKLNISYKPRLPARCRNAQQQQPTRPEQGRRADDSARNQSKPANGKPPGPGQPVAIGSVIKDLGVLKND